MGLGMAELFMLAGLIGQVCLNKRQALGNGLAYSQMNEEALQEAPGPGDTFNPEKTKTAIERVSRDSKPRYAGPGRLDNSRLHRLRSPLNTAAANPTLHFFPINA